MNYKLLNFNLEQECIQYPTFESGVKEIHRLHSRMTQGLKPEILPIIGETGAGKSTLLKYVCRQYPRKQNEAYDEIPILYVPIPKSISNKKVLVEVLRALDDTEEYSRLNEVLLQQRVLKRLTQANVKVILVDEFQHLVSSKDEINYGVADFFKSLLDNANISIVTAGLPDTALIYEANEQFARRARGPICLDRLKWGSSAESKLLAGVICGFSRVAEPLTFPSPAMEEVVFRWFCATRGSIGYISKIYSGAIEIAERENLTDISFEVLHQSQLKVQYNRGYGFLYAFDKSFDMSKSNAYLKQLEVNKKPKKTVVEIHAQYSPYKTKTIPR